MITVKLANGKEFSGTGEECFWFVQSEGSSIVAPPPVKDKIVNKPKAPKGWESVETSVPS